MIMAKTLKMLAKISTEMPGRQRLVWLRSSSSNNNSQDTSMWKVESTTGRPKSLADIKATANMC